MRPSQAARRLGERFTLVPNFKARRGPAGDQRGQSVGSSLEFQDRRAYQVGDDVRHLDWRAFARTDQLLVKQYEEELRPRLEILLDLSRSMSIEDEKFQTALDLVAILIESARRSSFVPKLVLLDDEVRPQDLDAFFEDGVEARGTGTLDRDLGPALGLTLPNSLRVLVSDCLSPGEPEQWITRLSRSAGQTVVLQVLGALDADPPRVQAERLRDVETGEALERIVDDGARARYLDRLERWNLGVERAVARVGGQWLTVTANAPLEDHVRRTFLASGMLEV